MDFFFQFIKRTLRSIKMKSSSGWLILLHYQFLLLLLLYRCSEVLERSRQYRGRIPSRERPLLARVCPSSGVPKDPGRTLAHPLPREFRCVPCLDSCSIHRRNMFSQRWERANQQKAFLYPIRYCTHWAIFVRKRRFRTERVKNKNYFCELISCNFKNHLIIFFSFVFNAFLVSFFVNIVSWSIGIT